MKHLVKKIPFVRAGAKAIYFALMSQLRPFRGSEDYWKERYAMGGNSGDGSYNKLSQYKADVLNRFVEANQVQTVIEYGTGDGAQLVLANYPEYTGYDVSPLAIEICRERFSADPSKKFFLTSEQTNKTAELTLSLDVVYHLVEDQVFNAYMTRLFDSATRFVIIYSSNTETQEKIQPPHVRHRKFTDWVETNTLNWRLFEHIPNKYPYNGDDETTSFSDFFIYKCI